MRRITLFLAALLLSVPAHAETEDTSFVRLPLNEYNRLVEASRDPKKEPRDAPAGYALGQASVNVTAAVDKQQVRASVRVQLAVKVFEDEWIAVPILPSGTPVKSASVSGQSLELISHPSGLLWGVKKAGSYALLLEYSVNGSRSAAGISLPIPLPRAASITFSAELPGSGLDPVVIPAAGTEVTSLKNTTRVTATIPTSTGVQLSWRLPSAEGHSISRASYRGVVEEEAVIWNGELNVELFNEEPINLRLLPKSITLSDVEVDDTRAPIMVEDHYFTTRIKGKGQHKVLMQFQVPVNKKTGPPKFSISIPPIPVSRFNLRLPGKKELTVTPHANVSRIEEGDTTIATVYVPMTEQVTFSWNEAVPEEIKEEVRANAGLYHTVYAEEGVLYVHASVLWDVTRGETNLIELELPEAVQVNRVNSANGGIADWRVTKGGAGKADVLSVFLDRQLEGSLGFDVHYDRSIIGEKAKKNISVPLLIARKVHRQRGMVALLSSKELTLKPEREEKLSRVGENQLPAFVRQTADKTIAHTYKYVEKSPTLIVQATKPERKQGKFDAVVNTLISLSDVTMKGSATVEINVKSGSIEDLQLLLPPKVNFLSLTAPSLRIHKVKSTESGQQIIDVQFTQEMEGQFRIETAYEQIMADSQADAVVPTLSIDGAEVEQGRIAVEALSAVEVRASSTKQLSSLEPNELPQQLVLKTTNPILLAYKYVHVDPPYQLALRITRHKEIDVQSATIDQAIYRTLITEDGLAVTSAHFTVRNSRKQFLRVQLPEYSEVWSAFVDGKPEKPALADDSKKKDAESKGMNVLIKIINSSRGFPVNLIFQTRVPKIGKLGTIKGILPRPDMVATNTRWDVYLPDDVAYGEPDTNMTIVEEGGYVSRKAIEKEVATLTTSGGSAQVIEPLRISVPASGIRYSFKKLYANKSDEDVYFSILYASGFGEYIACALQLLGAALLWFGIGFAVVKRKQEALSTALGSLVAGIVLLAVLIGYLGADPEPALLLTIVVAILSVVYLSKLIWTTFGQARTAALSPPPEDVPPDE